MNVLIYAGRGVSAESLHHTVRSLRQSIGHSYDVKVISSEALSSEPWEDTCRLLVLPGGRDQPFVEDLAGRPIDRIRRYVLERKGRLLGICAGAYFSCSRVEFEVGTKLAVVGDRELALCPAIAKGTVYPNFKYDSDEGAHAVPIAMGAGGPTIPDTRFYYNGGCWFDFSKNVNSPLSYQTMATFSEKQNAPAIVFGSNSAGQAVVALSGVHIEYDAGQVSLRQPNLEILPLLKESSEGRQKVWNWVLSSLGMDVNSKDESMVLTPTPINMFFSDFSRREAFLKTLNLNLNENESDDSCDLKFEFLEEPSKNEKTKSCDILINKEHRKDPTWTFSPELFYSLLSANQPTREVDHVGKYLLYAEYIDSTQTIVSQNPKFAASLPNGTIILAGDQLAGKGRGQNTWLSSKGCLQFTALVHHSNASTLTLIQYLELPIKLKWPNDLYTDWDGDLKKCGGILVNSQSVNDYFLLLIGFGTNVYDTPWTRSLNELVDLYNARNGTKLSPWSKELLLARFCGKFSELYRQLTIVGFPFEQYYKRWMHTGQVVFVEAEQMKARIEGIDKNGFLVVRPHSEGLLGLLDKSPEPSKPVAPFLLQPDGNSFDMMKNLIKRK